MRHDRLVILHALFIAAAVLCMTSCVEERKSRKEKRWERAVRRGYVQPVPAGQKLLPVPWDIYGRVKSQRDAIQEHKACNEVAGHSSHWLASAIQSASHARGRSATRRAYRINQRAARDRHDWSSDDEDSLDAAPSPRLLCLDQLVDEPHCLFFLHSWACNALCGISDEDDGDLHRDDANDSSFLQSTSSGLFTEVGGQSDGVKGSFAVLQSTSSGLSTEVCGQSDGFKDSLAGSLAVGAQDVSSDFEGNGGIVHGQSKATDGEFALAEGFTMDGHRWADVASSCSSDALDGDDFLHEYAVGDFVSEFEADGVIQMFLESLQSPEAVASEVSGGLHVSPRSSDSAGALHELSLHGSISGALHVSPGDPFTEKVDEAGGAMSKAWADVCSSEGTGQCSEEDDDLEESHVLSSLPEHAQATIWRPVGSRWVKVLVDPSLDGGVLHEDGDMNEHHEFDLALAEDSALVPSHVSGVLHEEGDRIEHGEQRSSHAEDSALEDPAEDDTFGNELAPAEEPANIHGGDFAHGTGLPQGSTDIQSQSLTHVTLFFPMEMVAMSINRALAKVLARQLLNEKYFLGASIGAGACGLYSSGVEAAVATTWSLPASAEFEILADTSTAVHEGYVDEHTEVLSSACEGADAGTVGHLAKFALVQVYRHAVRNIFARKADANFWRQDAICKRNTAARAKLLVHLRSSSSRVCALEKEVANLKLVNDKLIARLHDRMKCDESSSLHEAFLKNSVCQGHGREAASGPSHRGAQCLDVGGLSGNSGSSVPVPRSGNSGKTRKEERVWKQFDSDEPRAAPACSSSHALADPMVMNLEAL